MADLRNNADLWLAYDLIRKLNGGKFLGIVVIIGTYFVPCPPNRNLFAIDIQLVISTRCQISPFFGGMLRPSHATPGESHDNAPSCLVLV